MFSFKNFCSFFRFSSSNFMISSFVLIFQISNLVLSLITRFCSQAKNSQVKESLSYFFQFSIKAATSLGNISEAEKVSFFAFLSLDSKENSRFFTFPFKISLKSTLVNFFNFSVLSKLFISS